MANKSIMSLIKESREKESSEIINEQKKIFLLSDQKVLDKIVAGLLRDLKYL